MNAQALRWIEVLESDAKDEDGLPIYTPADKERVFNALTKWVKDYKRLFPEASPSEGAAVTNMRQWMRDPEFAKTMRELGYEKVPGQKAKGGAAAAAKAKDSEQKKAAEGSALRAMVFDGEGLDQGVMNDGL